MSARMENIGPCAECFYWHRHNIRHGVCYNNTLPERYGEQTNEEDGKHCPGFRERYQPDKGKESDFEYARDAVRSENFDPTEDITDET